MTNMDKDYCYASSVLLMCNGGSGAGKIPRILRIRSKPSMIIHICSEKTKSPTENNSHLLSV